MKLRVGMLATFLLFLFGQAAQAQNRQYLSHVANGSYSDGSFRTTFILFNNTATDALAFLELTDDNGDPLTVTIPGQGTDSEFDFMLEAGSSVIVQTDGSGPLVQGAATVTSTAEIGVSSIFTVYGRGGEFATESGVGSAQPLSQFVVPVDVTGSFNTGLALFNPSGSATVTLILRNTAGQEVGRTSVPLAFEAHLARFVTQLFPAASNFRGTLLVQSTAPIAALTLREGRSAQSVTYTSLPVVPTTSTQTAFSLAHVANGTYGSYVFRTSLLIFNVSGAAATVTLTLTQDNGSPFTMTFPGSGPGTGTGSTFTFTLQPGASVFMQSDGQGAGTSGAAQITSSAPVGATALFTVLSPGGQFLTEAGVGPSPVLTEFTLPVDDTGSFHTAVALFNPGTSAVNMTLRLMTPDGRLSGTAVNLTLGPKEHTARFVYQLFPGVANFRGTLAITAPGGAAAMTLRENPAPLSYTTLPVVAGSAPGRPPLEPLLWQTRSGIGATGNLTVNQTLPAGFRLTGTISGGVPIAVVAQAGQQFYFGSVDPLTGRYLIVLGPGSYTLITAYGFADADEGPMFAYSDPNPVQISGDTTRNIALPADTRFTVSGSVTGLGSLPGSQTRELAFTRADGSADTYIRLADDGSYSGQVAPGTYDVSLTQFSSSNSQWLSLYKIGALTVNDRPVTANYAVPPTATLTGRVQVLGSATVPNGTTVLADDTTAPPVESMVLFFPPTDNTASTDPTGQYQMVLMRNRSYDTRVSVPYTTGTDGSGTIHFPVTVNTVAVTGDMTRDFTLPAFPGQVVITGRVTDSAGRGVADVGVFAGSQSLSGAANLGYSGFASTDANGDYRLVVPSGTNYELTFWPPIPEP